MTIRQFHHSGSHVPFIASRSGESPGSMPLIHRHGRDGSGLGHQDEDTRTDRQQRARMRRLPRSR
ncbi:hypothetical protein NX801_03415 [Streptomyces sp. LP05-1]|uniref:Uncharacterized protein n=1 Tax=Streptomyces pyxinae TaxID=2970734 RepID=A0ABT2CBE0_9ACTN|nr:hypothetical protein [Streptomyces sp. LP05-1]MCS0634723.1 hypothetical protein [Streptomyces sp. LP05-1]